MAYEEVQVERSMSGAFIAVVAVALLCALGALGWCYGLQNHVAATERKLADAEQQNADLSAKLDTTNARLKATTETLGQSVGMTQKQIELKTQGLLAAQASQRAEGAAVGAGTGGNEQADWWQSLTTSRR